MPNVKTVKTIDGETVEYVDELIVRSSMKDVYFTPNRKNVVVFYHTHSFTERERLEAIIYKYNPTTDPETGEYWKCLYCWPTKIVVDGKRWGIVTPSCPNHFFFETGFNRGKEKSGQWFTSAKLRKMLDPSEKGNWRNYFKINILISRAIRKLHEMGLAHADLSHRSVLIDPKGCHVAIIEIIDCLFVPDIFPLDVLGTPDFIAPEVLQTQNLNISDKNRILPSMTTNLHALAVLIYMYLLYRHPLRGGKVHDIDPYQDELLSMGEKALFIEHPTDKSNRPYEKRAAYMPWADVDKIPYSVCGPYLKKLFDRAFIDGLHNPNRRPHAGEWEDALKKTVDLMQPCGSPECEQKWFVFDNNTKPECPFCR